MNSPFKHFALALAGLGVAAAAVPASAAPYAINQRQRSIDARIDQGVRSGALTRNEAVRLRTDFRNLSYLEARYRQTGGGLSTWERRDLDARFDRLSARVRVQKHDRQRW